MSGKLVGEVVDWLRTPVASGVSLAERVILLVIAERANPATREMWRHKADEENLFDRLLGATGLGRDGLTHALQKLGKRGLEVRVVIGTDKNGRPLYACKGRATRFALPEFPASFEIPERVPDEAPIEPVDNPESEATDDEQRVPTQAPNDAKGCPQGHPMGSMGASTGTPSPSTTYPSKEDPSSPVDPSSLVAVEDASPPAEILDDQKFDQGEYLMAQQRLLSEPDFGASLVAQLAAEYPDARREVHVIHAARRASQGAHA